MNNEINNCSNCKHFNKFYMRSDKLGFSAMPQGICRIKHEVQLIEYDCRKFEKDEKAKSNIIQYEDNIVERNIKSIKKLVDEIVNYITYK